MILNQIFYSFTINASGIIVGTIVTSFTYSALTTISSSVCFFTSKGVYVLSLLVGYSVDYLFGTRIANVASNNVSTCTDLFVIKPVQLVSNKTATITSIIIGSAAGLATSAILSSSSYFISKMFTKQESLSNNSLKINEKDDFLIIEHN